MKWNAWKQQRWNYDDVLTWWTRCIKQLKGFFTHEGAMRRRDKESLENYYYTTIYETMSSELTPERLHTKINVYGTKS